MNMRQSGVYGTDREIAAFSSSTQLTVVVFLSDSNRWMVFEGSENFQTLGQVFLFHESNHFRIVKSLVYRSSFLAQNTIPNGVNPSSLLSEECGIANQQNVLSINLSKQNYPRNHYEEKKKHCSEMFLKSRSYCLLSCRKGLHSLQLVSNVYDPLPKHTFWIFLPFLETWRQLRQILV